MRLLDRLKPLVALCLACSLSACQLWPFGNKDDEDDDEPVVAGERVPGQVIDPDIYRRDVKVAEVDTENFEIGSYTGIFGAEDLGSDLSYGIRAGYLMSEDFFIEAHYMKSTVSDAVRRSIGQPFFSDGVIDLKQYGVVLGYNVFPGEIFLGRRFALKSDTYILSGVGNTTFNGEDYMTYQVGGGIKVYPKDWVLVRLEARDSVWQSDLLGHKKWTNNFEFNIGLGFFF